ncbi:MAG: hypothetical protein ABIA93_04170 [Candidatus Woesearchaeota archaeon]
MVIYKCGGICGINILQSKGIGVFVGLLGWTKIEEYTSRILSQYDAD